MTVCHVTSSHMTFLHNSPVLQFLRYIPNSDVITETFSLFIINNDRSNHVSPYTRLCCEIEKLFSLA